MYRPTQALDTCAMVCGNESEAAGISGKQSVFVRLPFTMAVVFVFSCAEAEFLCTLVFVQQQLLGNSASLCGVVVKTSSRIRHF